MFASPSGRRTSLRELAASGLLALFALLAPVPADAASSDPAVQFMERVARDLVAASRVRSPAPMAAAINRYGAISAIALSALGNYRPMLSSTDQQTYIAGTVGFMARYVAGQAPKYPVSHVEFLPEARRAKYGLMVDSRIHLRDGTVYDVAWMLIKAGGTFRVRDAQVMGFWATPLMQQLFENYIAENGGNPKALVMALNR